MNTQQKIQDMLTENTGSHFLDSGGAYGRHWSRNQDRNFEVENCADFSLDHTDGKIDYFDITISLYHWLIDRLNYDQKKDDYFQNWMEKEDPEKDDYALNLMEKFTDHLEKNCELSNRYTENSYNSENLLSQVVQYTCFEIDDYSEVDDHPVLKSGNYILLQIHGGCDVRGGYTEPVLFEITGEQMDMFEVNKATIACSNNHFWDTYDGHRLDQYEDPIDRELTDYDLIDLDLIDKTIEQYRAEIGIGQNEDQSFIFGETPEPQPGVIILYDKNYYCPICAEKLEAYF